ncbi:hypothetical protein [Gilliamella sp. ESL0250]|uniref:hypothetical protein n=1 Tax=Gilliamella sp. ESL0250 TaxID=2705036 RepID=UPI001580559E|nr:hypothetical protein [Gilliamella sp. ESL0250]NUF50142.1 hypothetical protein [Gilliamella sp. ESL0250]
MNIELDRIENFFNLIIKELKGNGIHNIPIDYDFYWNIPSDLLYDLYNEPKELDMGQLSEDYQFLLYSISQDILTSGNLRKLSSLLRYIADKLDM